MLFTCGTTIHGYVKKKNLSFSFIELEFAELLGPDFRGLNENELSLK